MHRLSGTVSLSAIFLISLITLGNEVWGQPQKWEEFGGLGVAPTQEAIVSVPTSLIIDDPLGDSVDSFVDIDAVEGGTNGTDVTLKILFSTDTNMSSRLTLRPDLSGYGPESCHWYAEGGYRIRHLYFGQPSHSRRRLGAHLWAIWGGMGGTIDILWTIV